MVKACDLIKQQKEREDRKFLTFEKVFKLVEKKICFASLGNFYTTWYQIPTFLIGLPLYSVDDCAKYITNKLNKNGFETVIVKPNIIVIKWSPPTLKEHQVKPKK
jgi:hypothetical protein